jgi:hypothetical protein
MTCNSVSYLSGGFNLPRSSALKPVYPMSARRARTELIFSGPLGSEGMTAAATDLVDVAGAVPGLDAGRPVDGAVDANEPSVDGV